MKNYFTISELTASFTAQQTGIDNTPPKCAIDNLHLLITECLNLVRSEYGKPIIVTSGYRCERLNAKIGGKPTSQHLRGEAADLVGENNEETRRIFEAARKVGRYDQLLYERNSVGKIWVHISYKKTGNRGQCIDNYKA